MGDKIEKGTLLTIFCRKNGGVVGRKSQVQKREEEDTNLQDKLCFWAILTEPLEEESCLDGEVEVDIVEVFHNQVVVLLGLRQHVLLYV